MTVINLRVTPAEMNAIEVGLDTIIEQLMHPYHKDNRQKLIMALEAQESVECALEDSVECALEDSDLKVVLDYMLDYGGDGSLPNMDENESGDKAYEAALRLAIEVGSKSYG